MNEVASQQAARGGWVAIVANPYSGALENRSLVAKLEAALRRRGIESRVLWELGEFAAAAKDAAFASSCRCVVAAGGDGTIAGMINDLPLSAAAPNSLPGVAVLPLGTENLFARQFSFAADAGALAGRIAAGRTIAIDLGRSGETWFSTVASAGFDGDVAHRLARWRKREKDLRRVRRHSYLAPIAVSALKYQYPRIDVVADGKFIQGALVMIFNLPQYGFGFDICPHADPADGMLDYLVFQRPGRARLGLYALALKRRKHLHRSDIIIGKARRLELRSAEPVPMEMDGEAAGFTPCVIETVPGALRVIAAE